MAEPKCTNEEFITVWNQLKSPAAVAKAFGMDVRTVYNKRKFIEQKYNIVLETENNTKRTISFNKDKISEDLTKRLEETRHSVRRGIALEKGIVLVFSDAHFYPEDYSTAFRALLMFIKAYKPEVIVCNGDAFDGASISRHPRIGWDSKPSVIDELKAVQDHLGSIEEASTFKSNLIWTLGNHDARFENFLAAQAPQYEGVQGFTLKDHFPLWQPCWSYWINNDVVVKHRWKGGRYAGSNNTTFAGTSIVTGHTHQLKVEPFTDYRGTRYGIQTGCLANPMGDQFSDYTEDNPKDWRSGFAVLTFHDGKLLPPELVQVWDEEEGEVTFRGKIYKV
jgi:predicted phosphodiesterase